MTGIDDLLAVLDGVIGPRTAEQIAAEQERNEQRHLASMGVFVPRMGGIGTVTKQCPHCGGTMVSNYEQDDNGNIINQGPFICTNCGGMA